MFTGQNQRANPNQYIVTDSDLLASKPNATAAYAAEIDEVLGAAQLTPFPRAVATSAGSKVMRERHARGSMSVEPRRSCWRSHGWPSGRERDGLATPPDERWG